jgi:hypothetical protein
MRGGIAAKIFSAAIIKTDLNNPACIIGERQVGQPVMHVHAVAPAGAASTIALAARWLSIGSSTIATSHIRIKITNEIKREKKEF